MPKIQLSAKARTDISHLLLIGLPGFLLWFAASAYFRTEAGQMLAMGWGAPSADPQWFGNFMRGNSYVILSMLLGLVAFVAIKDLRAKPEAALAEGVGDAA